MPDYISLVNFTDQGIRAAKDLVKRADAAREAAKKFGVTMKEFHWTLGAYDAVATFEAPDDATIAAFGLAIGMQGNVRSQTMRALTRDEMAGVLQKLP